MSTALNLVDSHVNLHGEVFAADLQDVLARARAAGVRRMVGICDRITSVPAIAAIAAAEDDIHYTVGAHPHHAKDHRDLTSEALIALAQADPKVCAIGETGLDLHYGYSPLDQQTACFRAHISAARALDLPLILHTREADAHTGAIMQDEQAKGPVRWLLHCYTSGMDLARLGWSLGAYISFSGIVTFKSAEAVRAVAREAPLDRLLVETDCPYLAPIPHRGRRCEPAMVAEVARALAELRGMSVTDMADLTSRNFHRLFHTVPAHSVPA